MNLDPVRPKVRETLFSIYHFGSLHANLPEQIYISKGLDWLNN